MAWRADRRVQLLSDPSIDALALRLKVQGWHPQSRHPELCFLACGFSVELASPPPRSGATMQEQGMTIEDGCRESCDIRSETASAIRAGTLAGMVS